MRKKLISSVVVIGFFSGCVYTDSALQYAKEGTYRVQSGYDAKAEMTKHLTDYLAIQNKDCGVKVEMINNTPVTTVKECVRIDDALRVVENVKIVEPQQVTDMVSSFGDLVMKSTNLVVPFAQIYYNHKNTEVQTRANVEITKSNNDMMGGMISNYTANYQNSTNTSTDTSSVLTTNTTSSTTDTSNISTNVSDTSAITNTTSVPDVSIDTTAGTTSIIK